MIYAQQKREALTLIETMVVISIVGALVVFLLNAVNASRQAAYQLACINNLKQFALALSSYEVKHSRYPGVFTETQNRYGTNYSAHSFSPIARILSELDQIPLYNACNFTLEATNSDSLWSNLTCMGQTLNVCICPAETSRSIPGYGRSNYRFNIGPGPWIAPAPLKQLATVGPFTSNMFYSASSFSDGLSHTVGISEKIQGSWSTGSWSRGDYYLTGVGDQLLGGIPDLLTVDWVIAVCNSTSKPMKAELRAGESWFVSGFHFTNYNHCMTPNTTTSDCSLYSFDENFHWRTLHEGVFSASSYHKNSVNCAFMDGSVRTVRNSIHLSVWRALATRNMYDISDQTDF